MQKNLIGYCEYCDKPVYNNKEYFVTIDDKVVHNECLDDYLYEHQEI